MGAAPPMAMPAPVCIPQQEIVDVVRAVPTYRYQDVPTPVPYTREVQVPHYQDYPVVQCQNVTVPVPVNRPVPYPVPQIVTKVCGLCPVCCPQAPRAWEQAA